MQTLGFVATAEPTSLSLWSPWHHLIGFKDSGYTSFLGHENSASMFHIIRAPTQPFFTLTGDKKKREGLCSMVRPAFDSDVKWELWSRGDGSVLTREVNCLLPRRLKLPLLQGVSRDASRPSAFHIIQFGVLPTLSRAEGRFVEETSNIFKCWMARERVFEMASQVSCNPESRAVSQQTRNHWGLTYSLLDSFAPCLRPNHLSHLRK